MTDREELKEIAKQAAEEAVQGHGELVKKCVDEGIETALVRLGMDVSKPLETQADMQFLRATRKSANSIKSKAVLGVVGIAVTGTVAWFLSKLGR